MRLFLLTATAGMTFFFSLACGGQEMDNEVKVTEFEALLASLSASKMKWCAFLLVVGFHVCSCLEEGSYNS